MIRVLILIGIVVIGNVGFAQPGKRDCGECDPPAIKFLITHNLVHSGADEAGREIWIFLDNREFSERTLSSLFAFLGKRYPSPQKLNVWVETSWDTIPSPNIGEDGTAESGSPDRERRDEHHWASFLRRGGDAMFRYNPRPGSKEIKTVVVTGKAF